jgi:hypothetical protein
VGVFEISKPYRTPQPVTGMDSFNFLLDFLIEVPNGLPKFELIFLKKEKRKADIRVN